MSIEPVNQPINTNQEPATTDERQLFIVGIGASAGGLEALERFFKSMPADTGAAFVIIQHLSPDFKSVMDELLARHTRMPIHRVENGMLVEANSIYLIPPRKEMIISAGRLLLTDKDPQQDLTLPIDHFFRSLAQDCGRCAVAVVLSGTGSDGSRGLRHIHESGGLVIVQSAETAKFDGMPRSARDTGLVDLDLTPEEMPTAIAEHVKRRTTACVTPESPDIAAPEGVDAIFKLLRDEYGIDFSYYKPNTVTRRIERRLSLNQSVDLADYVDRLRSDSAELNSLYRDLLIGVTRFFRDREAFDRLEKEILPDLFAGKHASDELRFWVAGCATGEEAYSLAILIHERLQLVGRSPSVKIFATDVHTTSLEIASTGIYDEEALAEVKPSRLATYFAKKPDGYHISPEIRQMIVFARHNIIKDAPFTKIDLITCRNLLIYFQPLAQKKALSLFHFGLRTGGVLFLGPSESPGELSGEFESLDEHWKIYRKRRDLRLPADMRLPLSNAAPHIRMTAPPPSATPLDANLLFAYDKLLEEHMPPGLLITDRRQMVHAFGGAGQFLKHRDGRPSTDILDLVEGDLKLALAGSMQRAAKDLTSVVYHGVRITTPAGIKSFKLTVTPLLNRQSNLTHLFVALEELGVIPDRGAEPTAIDVDQASREQLHSLEGELRHTRENLQATIEELETSNEELQASNEELVASNEELQSTNEELHSVNEELYTVNAEYQKKITELTELTDDMDNLLRSTEIGTIFLDHNLCIRKFTPQIGRAFDLLPQDIGRRIDSFSHNIAYTKLLEDVAAVLQTGTSVQKEVRDRKGVWFFLRIFAYRSHGKVEGVVLTLIDISLLKRAESRLQRLSAIVESSDDAIIGMDLNGCITSWNPGAQRLYGYTAEEVMEKSVSLLQPPGEFRDMLDWPQEVMERMRSGQAANYHHERVRRRKDGSLVDVLMSVSPIRDSEGALVGVSKIARDISERKKAEKRLIQAEAEARDAVARRDRFLAMLSHELRNPLAAIVNASCLLERTNGDAKIMGKALGAISRQSQHMARLLDDLLDVSRITRDKIEIRKQTVDLRQTARDALEALRALFDTKDLRLKLEIADTPILVNGDPARLQQVHVNLLNNAIKYTPAGGMIHLALRRDGDQAVLSVRDTGVGIPVDMQEKIFDIFVQLDQSNGATGSGMGVGLTLVRALVQMHGGNICVYSDGPGKGSEFVVRLPITAEGKISPPPQKERPAFTGLRVLLVEDNPDLREVTQTLLAMLGCEVTIADDGVTGVEAALKHCPPVALIDIGLPGLSGLDVARRIRQDPRGKQIKLIALTGFGRPEDRQKAFEAGFNAHLVKPFVLEQLAAMLSDMAVK